MTKLVRFAALSLALAPSTLLLRAADSPPVVIERAPETDPEKQQQEIAALRAENQRLANELRDAQWALGEAKTRIDELSAPRPAPEPDKAAIAAEKARADEANARLATIVAGVEKLNTEKADLERRLAAAGKTETELRQQLAAAAKAAVPAVPPDTVAKLTDAEAKLAEASRRVSLLQAENQLLAKTSADHAKSSAELQTLRQEKAALEAKLASAQSPSPAGDPAELASKLAQTEAKLSTVLRSYSQLQNESEQWKQTAASQTQQTAELNSLRQEKAALEARLTAADQAAATKAPAVDTTEITNKLAQTEAKLETALHSYAQLQKENEQLKQTTSSRNDQSAELEKLRQDKAALEARIAAIPPDQSHVLASRLADTEDKLNTTLRSYTLLQRENDKLKADAAQIAETSHSAAAKSASETAAQTSALFDELRQTQAQVTSLASENAQLKTKLALAGSLPGSTLASPTRPGSAQASALSTSAPAPSDTPPPAAPAEGRTHTVVLGDTLGRISRQYYGTPSRWEEIFRANRDVIKNENALVVGTKLRIP